MTLTTPLLDPNLHSELWGDGGDGAVAIGVNTTLTRNMNYTNLTVDAGVFWLNPANWIIHCTGTCAVGAGNSIICPGNAAANEVGGAALLAGSCYRSSPGSNGGVGGAAGTAGQDTPVGLTDGVTNYCTGGAGGAGEGGARAGGAAGGTTAQPAIGPTGAVAGGGLWTPSVHVLANISFGMIISPSLAGGAGGGGGGGGGIAAGNGGGGGGGAGFVVIFARTIVLSATATISAIGGAGANGTAANGGGGGGGGGGHIILVYETLIDPGATITAAGGAFGLLDGTGANGAAGVQGTISSIQI